MKNKIFISINVFTSFLLFSTAFVFTMYTPHAHQMRQKYGLMRRRPLQSQLFLTETFLVPTNSQTMNELGLCPLFSQKENYQMDPGLMEEMVKDLRRQNLSEADIKLQLAGLNVAPGPKYHVFKTSDVGAEFEEKSIGFNAPCVVDLGRVGAWNRRLLQLKSLDQFELAEKTSLSPALCAGHALNNACLMRDYAETGEIKYLKYLHNMNDAANFLLNLKIDDWINVEVVKQNLQTMSKDFTIDVSNISAVSTVALFDSNVDKTPEFSLFNQKEFEYVQDLKQKLQEGLKQNCFVHVIVIGNEEAAESHGHYFAFAIVKLLNEIQYIVLDTLPNVYHLQEGSQERDRLMYLIQNIEQGTSDVSLANMRAYLLRLFGAFDEEQRVKQ